MTPVDPPSPTDRHIPSARRTWVALGVVFGALAGFNVARSVWIPGDWHFAANVALWALMVVVARIAWLNPTELGLARSQCGRGARWGGTAAVVVAAVVVAAAYVPAAEGLFDDDRAAIGVGRLLLEIVIVIPFGTVLLEEFAFRGVLFGLLRRVERDLVAVAVSALLFGLWHVLPTFGGNNGGLEGEASSLLGETGLALGTFAATAVAGLVFAWLRLRSHSLVAPILAHLATNSVPLVVAWLLR